MTTTLEESIPACIREVTVTQNESSTEATAACMFPRSFCGFKGHFPENPILPAIVQLATVRKIAERILDKPLVIRKCTKTKFRAMIRPDERTFFHLVLTRNEASYDSRFKITDVDGTAIASGLCQFTSAE